MTTPFEKTFSPASPAASLMVCGKSGSGKTTLLAKLCRVKKLPCVVIGRSSPDFDELGENVFYHNELTESITKIRNACVIVDDLFSLNSKAHSLFRTLVCYSKRHQNVTVLVGVHSLNYTGMLNLCSQFDFMAFTQCPASDINAKIFVSWHKTDALEARHFDAIPERGYLIYNWKTNALQCLTKHLMPVNDDGLTDPDEVRESVRSGINAILSAFPAKESVAKCLLDFLLRNIDIADVDRKDFTLKLGSKGVKASMIDYLLVSQEESGQARPKDNIVMLHRHWASKFTIPDSLIKNKLLNEPAKKARRNAEASQDNETGHGTT